MKPYRPPLPGTIATARALIFIQAVLVILVGLVALAAGSAVGSISTNLGGAVAIVSIIFFVIGGLWIWVGVALGKLSAGARITALIFEWLGLALTILGLVGSVSGSSSGSSPASSVIGIAWAGTIIYCLQFAPASQRAFAAARGAMPPPGYPGQPMYPGQPGSYGASPPPPPAGYAPYSPATPPPPPAGYAPYSPATPPPPPAGYAPYSPGPPATPPAMPPAAPPPPPQPGPPPEGPPPA